MPILGVYDFTQKIKQYVRDTHVDWFVTKILVVYSTRSKSTDVGYNVTPLYVGVIAYDNKEKRVTNCRIQFDELCKIIDPIGPTTIVPYISVWTKDKKNRNIFDTGVTCLHIECAKTGTYNDRPYVKHHTERVDNKPFFDKLNDSVLNTIKERLAEQHKADMKQMETQYRELLDFPDDDYGEEDHPDNYDYNENISITTTVGGYKD